MSDFEGVVIVHEDVTDKHFIKKCIRTFPRAVTVVLLPAFHAGVEASCSLLIGNALLRNGMDPILISQQAWCQPSSMWDARSLALLRAVHAAGLSVGPSSAGVKLADLKSYAHVDEVRGFLDSIPAVNAETQLDYVRLSLASRFASSVH